MSSEDPQGAAGGVPSIISPDLKIVGDLNSNGEIQIDGTVKGDIKAHMLTVGEQGKIDGSTVAEIVRIFGTVNGWVQAKTVRLDKSARVTADITHESLTTPSEGERLRALSVPPQRVRSKHVHRGELAADELLPILIHNPFKDPSFDEMIDELSRVSRVCLIEWLRCRGNYRLVLLPRGKRTLAARVRATAAAVWRWIRRIPLPRIPVL